MMTRKICYQIVFSILGSGFWLTYVEGGASNITIGYLQNGTTPNVVLEEMLAALTSNFKYKVNFQLKYFDVNSIQKDSFQLLGTNIMSHVSVLVAKKVPLKISQSLTKILQIPLLTTELAACHSNTSSRGVNCINEFAISAGYKQLSSGTLQILKKMEFANFAVVFQTKRINDLTAFMNNIGGSLIFKLFPVETDGIGNINNQSIQQLKSLKSSIESLIILIYDEKDLPNLFQVFKSSDMEICHRRIKLFYYGLAFNDFKEICDWHTVLGMQVHKASQSFAMTYNSHVEDLVQSTQTLQDLLLFDALFIITNVTAKLIEENLWQSVTELQQDEHSARISNTANFTAKLRKTTFHGATGIIEFDSDMSRFKMALDVINMQESKFKKIGEMTGNDMVINFDETPRENILYRLSNTKINGHLIAVTIIDEPFTFEPTNRSDPSTYTGFCIDILKELARTLNFTYSIYVVRDDEYGRNKNGTWTGMVGDVLYKKADIAIASLTVTSVREEVIQFTKPYMELQNSYVRQRSSMLELDYFQYLKPFTTNVWLLIVFATIFSSSVLYFVDYFSPFGWRLTMKERTGKDGDVFSVSNSIWFTMASLLLQGGDNTPRTLSGRIIVGTLWFVILIVTSSYTANMAAYFTFSKSITESENIESLLKEGVTFSLKQNTALDQFLQNSDYKVYKLLSEKIKQQQKYVKNALDGLAKAREDPNLLFIGEGPYSEWQMNKHSCDLKIVYGIFPSRSYGFPVRKGSPIAEKISIGISELIESNFIQERIHYYWKELSNCKDDNGKAVGITSEGRIEPLQLIGVYGCLVIGLIVSVIVLIFEIWWKRNLQDKKQKLTTMIRRVTTLRRVVKTKRKNSNAGSHLSSFPSSSVLVHENEHFDEKF